MSKKQFTCSNFNICLGGKRELILPHLFSPHLQYKTLKLSNGRWVDYTCVVGGGNKSKRGFADKLRWKSAAFEFLLLEREVVMQWKIDTKEIWLSQNRVICVEFFRYGKQARGHWIDHLIYAANVLLSLVLSHFTCLQFPHPNCQPQMMIFFLGP